MGDPYVDPRTAVLRNRLGITDADELRTAETDISTAALFALETSPYLGEGHFDFGHLRALHVQIFGEVYAWAGKPRSVDIGKGQWFCRVRQIPEFAASIFADLAAENYLVGLDRHDLVRRIAATYGQLNALHPFREGNGRTQRAFLTQLGRLGGWRLRWADLDGATNDEASRRSLEAGDDSALALMVDELLEEEPPRPLPTGPRRVVLAVPAVAREVPGGMTHLRLGPYPASARCADCDERYALADEPTVLCLGRCRGRTPGSSRSRTLGAESRGSFRSRQRARSVHGSRPANAKASTPRLLRSLSRLRHYDRRSRGGATSPSSAGAATTMS